MNIVIYGHDYPALVTAASLASNGNAVTILPLDAPVDWTWQDTARKQSGLAELLTSQQQAGRLHWADAHQLSQLAKSHIHILSFTPAQGVAADELVGKLAALFTTPTLLVTQTLHGVGRAQHYQQRLQDAGSSAIVVVWPEFMSEGAAISQFSRPDRIIIGTDNDWAINQMRDLLRPYNRARDMLLVMSPSAAEMTKYAINMLLALRVSAMNEFANLAERMGVDIEQVRQGIGTDPRIGFNYLYPGAGFGGPNFMADLSAILSTFEQQGQQPQLLPAALRVNEHQQEILFSKLWQHYQTQLSDKTFALWGISYKPDTATIAQASSLRLIDALLAQGARLQIHDPKALSELALYYPNHPQIVSCNTPYDACVGATALLIMTEWKDYWNPDFDAIKARLLEARIFDGRNLYDPAVMQDIGFHYHAVGRGES
jgi:UDPglucose 6-dehydrogenase